MTAQKIDDRRRGAVIVDRRELGAGRLLDEHDIEVTARSDTEGTVVEHARLLLTERDEVGKRLHRNRWVNDERLWADAKSGNRRKVVDRIVWKLAVCVRIGDERGVCTHQKGVTVGRR